MKKVYIAGKLRDNAINYVRHCHRMIKTAKQVRDLGCAVYVPCLDLLELLINPDLEFENLFNNSFEWVKVSDAVFLTPGWETSKGTEMEIELAHKLNIPVFDKLEDLRKWLKQF